MNFRRLIQAVAAAGCAAVLASGCSASDASIGGRPQAPSVAFGGTAPPSTGAPAAQNCDPARASAAPDSKSAQGSDVQAIEQRSPRVVKIGVAADQYLTGYLGPDGTEQGFDIDLGHAIAQSLFGNPDDVQFVVLSTANRINALESHQVDLVIDTFTITCDRLADIDFSAVYYEASQRLLVPQGSSAAGLADLGGQNVCAQKGSTSIGLIQATPAKPAPPVAYQVANITDCLVLLQENKVAAISTDDTLLAGLQAQDPNLKVVGPPLEPEPYGIGIPSGETDMEQYVNGVLAGYESDGGWAASYRHWFLPSLGAAAPPVAQYSD